MNDFSCPAGGGDAADTITLALGEGGRLTRRFIADEILPIFASEILGRLGDATELPAPSGPIAITTDSFVVSPLFFPGGDIGSLAVFGSANDLAVAGARPLWISLAMIIEEGFSQARLSDVLQSIATAAGRAEVQVVAGDTKVVPRGAVDQLFLCTTGVGELLAPAPPGPAAIQPGDVLLVSGPIGRHGVAVMCAREDLKFDPAPTSDSAPLFEAVAALWEQQIPVRAMRDATRGGLSAVLHEWAAAAGVTMSIVESQLPVTAEVRGACELLGLDPVHVACEGTMVVAVPPEAAEAAVVALQACPVSRGATPIGTALDRDVAPVIVHRGLRQLPLDEPLGAPLPRIC